MRMFVSGVMNKYATHLNIQKRRFQTTALFSQGNFGGTIRAKYKLFDDWGLWFCCGYRGLKPTDKRFT